MITVKGLTELEMRDIQHCLENIKAIFESLIERYGDCIKSDTLYSDAKNIKCSVETIEDILK
ncbi:hypothetical protein [Enterocloster bolteae]|uniref:hypothetical protein n=1 Tax=Enterocloster bolteae TaxID=208479 RepID=UPI0012F9C821|nr:hypothetical protein [Enterocloster bolteae]